MSLSSFIRDYVYIPLGGNRFGFGRTQFNLIVAMTLSGLWHGANITYLIWGLLHAFGVVFLNINARFFKISCNIWLSRISTLIFITFAWVFFRSDTLDHAFELLRQTINFDGSITVDSILLILLSIVFLYISQKAIFIENYLISAIEKYWGWKIFTVISGVVFFMIYAGPNGIPTFIYFKF
jgi:D-alanyl-lipoteichoic acid acyltransferase DltB (MBOAT superfamily)